MPMSYLMEDSSREWSDGGDPLRPATPRLRSPRICRVTYWITYCKVTRIPDIPRLKVRLSSAGHRESRSFTSEHNHDGRGRQLAGGPVGVHRRAGAACGTDSPARQRSGVVGGGPELP